MIIHYISPYADTNVINEYMTTPSARAKVEYIKDTLKEIGFCINLYSPIRKRAAKICIQKRKKIIIDKQETQFYPCSIGGDSLLAKILSYVVVYSQLIIYLLLKVNSSDNVILYHSIPETYIIKNLCRFLNIKVILEIEELYSAAYSMSDKIDKEKRLVSGFAKGFLLVNTIIGGKCNLSQPSVVCEGQYKMQIHYKKTIFNNNHINLLYAGVIKKEEDVFLALDVAEKLDDSFCLHVAGYGDKSSEELVVARVQEINSLFGRCKVVYHGCLYGDEYESLLNECSIGLCTRMLENNLSDYTFPSKVYAYLTRNLRVICTPISCVINSNISKGVFFSESVTAESIVKAIYCSIDKQTIDNSFIIEKEHNRFRRQITDLFV